MNRLITQIGQSIYEWFFTKPAQDNMVALGKLAAAVLGTSPLANGLSCTPTSPASLQVNMGPGEIYALAPLEASIFGTLPVDTGHQIVKQGILLDPYLVSCPPPSIAGQAINYLIEVQYQDQDVSVDPTTGSTAPVVLQFYNASNPTQPWQGPNNSGQTSNTLRNGIVAIQAKAGIAAPTGSPVTPAPDAGWTGLWVVTVANGQATITAGNITAYAGAPFLTETLTQKISQVSGDARYLQPSQAPSVMGTMVNAKMAVASASASATFTADEVVVKTGFGGTPYLLGNFSQTVSTSATGIGGVVGAALTANGYAAIYAAYNPTTRAQGAFIVNANSLVPNVAAAPPAGWVATALLSVWPLNASTQFIPGTQRGRRVGLVTAGGFAVSATQTSYASVAVSGVPANAVRVQGNLSSLSTLANATIIFSVAPDAAGTSAKSNVSTTVVANNGTSMPVEIDIFTPQTLYYRMPGSTGTPSMSLVATSYDF
ncbi:hypothetical protein [Pandoraea sputorum]|uniref:Tail fiber protein n=1 Tax=Pandoraea sputorum TaxID=93222 RepID=A0A5E5BJ25_9BURK|nr:hypothetical protein [Pandoraea sputorum]VVE85045.1 Tail fiber protein [Pandoraea sputorum]